MPPKSTKQLMIEVEQSFQAHKALEQRKIDQAKAAIDPAALSQSEFVYLMLEDPGAPFTDEETPEETRLKEIHAEAVAARRIASNPAVIKAEQIGQRLIAAKEAGKLAAATSQNEPEDPQLSQGGGRMTLQQEGFVPAGRVEDATTQVTRGRGGKLVTRVTLAGKFIDVPVEEHSSNTSGIEAAKERLVHGKGTPESRLRRRANQ